MSNKKKSKMSNFKRKLKHSKWSPVRAIESEEKRTIHEAGTGRIKIKLSKQEALLIAAAAIISAFISIWVRICYILRFSHFESNAVMQSWLPFGAPLKILGITLFIYCCVRKGVDYWLVYFGAVTALVYFFIEGLLIHDIVDVNTLAEFFKSIGIYYLPEWIIGSGV